MDCVVQTDKEVFWRKEQELFRETVGSASAFCRSRGHVESQFRYWLEKIEGAKPVAMKSEFIAVKVDQPKRVERRLPDPIWLAEFILHLSRGGGQ
jgi:hypothetical protein